MVYRKNKLKVGKLLGLCLVACLLACFPSKKSSHPRPWSLASIISKCLLISKAARPKMLISPSATLRKSDSQLFLLPLQPDSPSWATVDIQAKGLQPLLPLPPTPPTPRLPFPLHTHTHTLCWSHPSREPTRPSGHRTILPSDPQGSLPPPIPHHHHHLLSVNLRSLPTTSLQGSGRGGSPARPTDPPKPHFPSAQQRPFDT